MNLASSRLCPVLSNASCVRHIARSTRERVFELPNARNSLTVRNKSTKHNLFGVNQGSWKSQSTEEIIRPSGWFLLSIPIATFGLGTWQVQRRKWKLNLIEDLDSRISADPIDLPKDLYEVETMEYQPVKLRGRFLHEKEFTVGPRSLILEGKGASEGGGGLITHGNSNTGYNVITPFELEDRNLTILVNRGWVPMKKRDPQRRQAGQVQGVVEITGTVRLNETRPPFIPKNDPDQSSWFYRDLNAMAEKCDTAPVFIDLAYKDSPEDGPIGGQTRVSLRNEHMSYIVTWYSLSAITGLMWFRQFVLKLPLL